MLTHTHCNIRQKFNNMWNLKENIDLVYFWQIICLGSLTVLHRWEKEDKNPSRNGLKGRKFSSEHCVVVYLHNWELKGWQTDRSDREEQHWRVERSGWEGVRVSGVCCDWRDLSATPPSPLRRPIRPKPSEAAHFTQCKHSEHKNTPP